MPEHPAELDPDCPNCQCGGDLCSEHGSGQLHDYGKTTSDRCGRCGHNRYVHNPGGGCEFAAHYVADECPCEGFAERKDDGP